jgi:hypothetical protein
MADLNELLLATHYDDGVEAGQLHVKLSRKPNGEFLLEVYNAVDGGIDGPWVDETYTDLLEAVKQYQGCCDEARDNTPGYFHNIYQPDDPQE